MTKQQAEDRCKLLNATKYKNSRLKVKPYRLGPDWYTICGCGKEDLPADHVRVARR
jgi:hypothetical protein